jgi:hypothetical protein
VSRSDSNGSIPFYDVMPAKAGIQDPPNYRWDSCCAHIEVQGLLDRPVEPGDDAMGYALCRHGHYWPILNVKSPLTLCVSADTAFHSTL